MSVTDDVFEPPTEDAPDWRDAFLRFLKRKVRGSRRCKECGSHSVEITPALVTCPRWDPNEEEWSLNGITYPLALLVCKSCGHVNFYSAKLAGVSKWDVKKS